MDAKGVKFQSADVWYHRELREKIVELQTENERLKEAVEEAKVKRGQFREIIEALLVPTNFISIEAARDYICEAIEDYDLGKIKF